jgi:M6 family metalloprotease-like protein
MKSSKKIFISLVSLGIVATLSSCTIVSFTSSDDTTQETTSDSTSEITSSLTSEETSSEESSLVVYQPVTSLYISEDSFTLVVGSTQDLYAQVSPSTATIQGVTWESSNSEVMTVDSDGLVTAMSQGTATLTCISDDNLSISDSITIRVYEDGSGFSKMVLNATAQDLNRDYSESLGNQNVLIVPIHVSDIEEDSSWDEDELEELDDLIFNEDDPFSYVSYYKTASNGRLIMSGEVSDIYTTEYTKDELENSWTYIYDMFANAVEWIDENDSTVDIDTDYDQNDDGYIDNIHFVLDATSDVWGSNLWPHMSQTGNSPSTGDELPSVNTYSLSNTDHLTDAYTTIHEQGHIFGLQDYYNYSSLYDDQGNSLYVDYVGFLDMQSNTCFDWNVYSKMNMGWVDPYYFDGTQDSATIEIGPAASTGDCIVVGTDWNGNAFDEYITLELFADEGNNSLFWSDYSYYIGDGGVRISHVDSRMVNNRWQDVDDFDGTDSSYYLKYSNSVDSSDCYGYSFNDDYHLLQVIQANGTDTFTKPTRNYYDLFMNQDDLFQTGDTFSMDEYGEEFFANKTTLNNGDEFPYEISFDNVSTDSATITITKI